MIRPRLLDCGHPDDTPDVAHNDRDQQVCAVCCPNCAQAYNVVDLPARIALKIRQDEATFCWLWMGAVSGGTGYGGIKYLGRQLGAHRVIYELLIGPIPDGMQIDHLCRVRHCVNPAHLEPVTQRVNVLRGTSPAAKQAKATHCSRGHEFTPENTYWRPNGDGRDCRECIRVRRTIRAGQITEDAS